MFNTFKELIDNKNTDFESLALLYSTFCIDELFDDELTYTPLTYAIKEHKNKVVFYFIEKGADFYFSNIHGDDPFKIAYDYNNAAAVKELIRKTDRFDNHILEAGIYLKDFQLVNEGINRGGLDFIDRDGNEYDPFGYTYTPLHYAIYLGEIEIAKYLMDAGADLNLKAEFENSYLHLAVIRGYTEIVKKAMELGADMHQTGEEGYTPMDYAKSFSRHDIIEVLSNL